MMPSTAPTQPPTLIIMPILGARDYTVAAIQDCLAQSVPVRLLLVNQGVADDFREELEKIAEEYDDRILLWSHQPPMQSLSATWNRALDFAWECGGEEALVVNNDVRLSSLTIEVLRWVLHVSNALFVSAVGVQEDQYVGTHTIETVRDLIYSPDKTRIINKGGPDFSCFLISRACHADFRFDEALTPAYLEDLMYHRTLLLDGHGADIFSVNLPYLHYASGTLKSMEPTARQRLEQRITTGSRAYYKMVWGGDANHERFVVKGDPSSAADGVTTPDLQRMAQAGLDIPAELGL